MHHHLTPLAQHPLIRRIWLVRTHMPQGGEQAAIELVRVPQARVLRFPAMLMQCARLARRAEVRAFISFNPFPYGLLELPAVKLRKKKIHMGLIGSDWHLTARGMTGPLLRRSLRLADLITVTGVGMQREVEASGVEGNRIRVLPHSIDVERFTINDPARCDFDFIYVGRLVSLKRVDRIIDAFALVVATHPDTRLCIVGSGPLAGELRARAEATGVSDRIEFAGQQNDVASWLARSRVLVMASESEGLPFVLIEAQCAGLASVVTPVGSIREHMNGSGFLVESGSPVDLAERMAQLIDDQQLYLRMRAAALQTRLTHAHEAAQRVWDPWLESIAREP